MTESKKRKSHLPEFKAKVGSAAGASLLAAMSTEFGLGTADAVGAAAGVDAYRLP